MTTRSPLNLNGNATQQGYWSGTPAEKGVANEVWIAVRTDNQPGAGTAEDPFDGSTQPKFDALLRGFGNDTAIHLLPGMFLTNGWDDSQGTNGFSVKPGWKLLGHGQGVTTLKLASIVGSASFKRAVVVANNSYLGPQADGAEIGSLTIDCNGGPLSPVSGYAIDAISVAGNNIYLHDLEVIHSYADTTSGGSEGFAIYVGPLQTTLAHPSVRGVVIERCYVHSFENSGLNHNGIMVSGNAANYPTQAKGYSLDVVVRDCLVDGAGNGAFSTGGVYGLLLAGNRAINSGHGFYCDTGPLYGLRLIGNDFRNDAATVDFNGYTAIQIQNLDSSSGDWVIEGNYLESALGNGIGIQKFTATTSPANILILGNIFQATNTSGTLYFYDGDYGQNMYLAGNASNAGLPALALDTGSKIGPNNLGGAYTPDSDVMLKSLVSVQVISTGGSGTVTVPAGVTVATVEVQGAGGGTVGSLANDAFGGGGGGGYCRKRLTGLIPGATILYTIGTGSSSADGGDTVFNGVITAGGGKRGGAVETSNASLGGAGGTAAGGDLNIPGQDGGCGIWPQGRFNPGGASQLGRGAYSHGDGLANSTPGILCGGGASSGGGFGSAAAGAQGVIVITWGE